MKPVVLASSSPRRKDLLEKIGLKFTVDPVEVDEELSLDHDPLRLAKSISLRKAMAASSRHPDALIIAADTFGVIDGKMLGKPADEAQAVAMLEEMSGNCHRVITGFTIIDGVTGRTVSRAVQTMVYFRNLSKSEITDYVNTGEPLDKAGAYAIQGLGALLVERIDGDYYNVIGLPLSALAVELRKFGVTLPG
jgi:septum formation protein